MANPYRAHARVRSGSPGNEPAAFSLMRQANGSEIQTETWFVDCRAGAIRGCSVKVLQNERRLNIGCSFRRINGTTIRYKIGDITAFLESQPGGGGAAKPINQPRRGPGRPRRVS